MATFQNNCPITGGPGTAYLEIDTQWSQSGNSGWNVNFQVWYRVRGGWNTARNASGGGNFGWSNAGPWDGNAAFPADFELISNGFFVGVDANGNASYGLNATISLDSNSPYGTLSVSGSEGFPRIPLAPSLSSVTVDTVKSNSARLGAEISGYGHGTSATFEMFYRLQGSGTWISLGQQGDVGGFNYWSLGSLQPGKTYEYIVNCFNNNGDLAQSSVQTFKTQAVSGMISVMRGII